MADLLYIDFFPFSFADLLTATSRFINYLQTNQSEPPYYKPTKLTFPHSPESSRGLDFNMTKIIAGRRTNFTRQQANKKGAHSAARYVLYM